MIVHAIAVRKCSDIKDEEEYANRWGINGWELIQSLEVNNGIKFFFKKEFNDEVDLKSIEELVANLKEEISKTKTYVLLEQKIKKKKCR